MRDFFCGSSKSSILQESKMTQIASMWLAVKADRRAVTALEYGLIAGVIVAVILLGFNSLAGALSTQFTDIGDSL
jgi:Flp pilus assembly pilin Flp